MQEINNKQNSDFWEQDPGKEGSIHIWIQAHMEALCVIYVLIVLIMVTVLQLYKAILFKCTHIYCMSIIL